jgi:hypothetical protein
MRGEQKVNGLAVLISLPIPIAPLTLDLAVRLVRKLGGNTWEVLDARVYPWEAGRRRHHEKGGREIKASGVETPSQLGSRVQ